VEKQTSEQDISGNAQTLPLMHERSEFVATFGSIFEHSPWVAEQAFDTVQTDAPRTAESLHQVMANQFRLASPEQQLAVLKAHPDLAGKLAAAKKLTIQSTSEQAGAGLDRLTDAEKQTFTELNQTYVDKFGFPFIIAVKGLNKSDILTAFKTRINNDRPTELATACQQVETIALLRLKDLMP